MKTRIVEYVIKPNVPKGEVGEKLFKDIFSDVKKLYGAGHDFVLSNKKTIEVKTTLALIHTQKDAVWVDGITNNDRVIVDVDLSEIYSIQDKPKKGFTLNQVKCDENQIPIYDYISAVEIRNNGCSIITITKEVLLSHVQHSDLSRFTNTKLMRSVPHYELILSINDIEKYTKNKKDFSEIIGKCL